MSATTASTSERETRRRAKYLTDLLWHVGAFLIINAAFWLLDIGLDGGLNWAFWITAVWGFALAFHALAWFIDGRQVEERKAREYLRER